MKRGPWDKRLEGRWGWLGFSKERRSSEDENLLETATLWYDIWYRVEAHYIFCKWNNLNQFGRNEGIFELDRSYVFIDHDLV